jgi:ribosome-binding protein aMBF1 (putative translation factor)
MLTRWLCRRDNERTEIRRARNALRAPPEESQEGPAMTKHADSRAADTDFDTLRAQRQAAMTDAEREVYHIAYAEAGWAMDLAELVYTTRTQAGLTQAQLARAMGTSKSAIAAWESGARTPGIEALKRLARACGKHLHITIGAA